MKDLQATEIGIGQLYARYCDAALRRDTDAFVACFAEDAVWKIAGQALSGREEARKFLSGHLDASERIMMFTGIPVVDVADGAVTGRTQMTEYIKLTDGQSIRTLGVYYDRFVRKDQRWLFQWHYFDLYYYGPPDFSQPFYDGHDFGPPPGMPGPDEPTTVRREA